MRGGGKRRHLIADRCAGFSKSQTFPDVIEREDSGFELGSNSAHGV
jgi:hypothetical protein